MDGLALAFALFLLGPATAEARLEYAREAELRCVHCHVDRDYPGESFFEVEARHKWTLLWGLTGVSLSFLMVGAGLRVRLWRKGRAGGEVRDAGAGVAGPLVLDGLLQRRIWRLSRVRWASYALLSLGFLLLFVVALLSYLLLFVHGSRSFAIPGTAGIVIDVLTDLFGLSVLVGVVLATCRRYLGREGRARSDVSDGMALGLIAAVVVTGFFLEGCRIAALPYSSGEAWSFVGFGLSLVLRRVEVAWASVHFYTWNLHMLAALAFVAYIPYSKFAHILTCPVTSATYPRRTGFTGESHG